MLPLKIAACTFTRFDKFSGGAILVFGGAFFKSMHAPAINHFAIFDHATCLPGNIEFELFDGELLMTDDTLN